MIVGCALNVPLSFGDTDKVVSATRNGCYSDDEELNGGGYYLCQLLSVNIGKGGNDFRVESKKDQAF